MCLKNWDYNILYLSAIFRSTYRKSSPRRNEKTLKNQNIEIEIIFFSASSNKLAHIDNLEDKLTKVYFFIIQTVFITVQNVVSIV